MCLARVNLTDTIAETQFPSTLRYIKKGQQKFISNSSCETKLIIILIQLFNLHYVYHGPKDQFRRAGPQARTPGIWGTSAQYSGLRWRQLFYCLPHRQYCENRCLLFAAALGWAVVRFFGRLDKICSLWAPGPTLSLLQRSLALLRRTCGVWDLEWQWKQLMFIWSREAIFRIAGKCFNWNSYLALLTARNTVCTYFSLIFAIIYTIL